MPRRYKPLPLLEGEQADAVNPAINASVSASAGSGKTQVLTGRVLNLLLSGAAPETILCLTFTKAGAAEMANRIGKRLAAWVRLPDNDLRKDLFALGVADTPEIKERARKLFAQVLEAPGGLRVQTIHSFAQTLLASFPAEAGIMPGFRPIEGRAEQQLARTTLANLLADADARGDKQLLGDIRCLSLRLGEGGAVQYLMRCAAAPEAMEGLGRPDGIEAMLFRVMGLPEGGIEAYLRTECSDDRFDCDLLRAISDINRRWRTKEGSEHVARIERWLSLPSAERASQLPDLALVVFTKARERRKTKGQVRIDPAYQRHSDRLADAIHELLKVQAGAKLAGEMAAGLRSGQAFAAAYESAKHSTGVADFNDLIRWTCRLLSTPGMGEWVRYKLDRRTDHILVDESQDTNRQQWQIIEALAEEYFAGVGAAERRHRTLFYVGDFKQAIFRFQGTDPAEFEDARKRLRQKSQAIREIAEENEESWVPPEFRDLSIDRSFRSAPAILDAVDATIREIGYRQMGLSEEPRTHRAFHDNRPGTVELWAPFAAGEDQEDEGEEGWITEDERLYATALARQVRSWLDAPPVLASTNRPLSAGDILILVRSRSRDIASLIVARLFEEGVPVAGIDRLQLHKPFAVRDLLAAIGFAVQPLDDLNLANLLISPLIGWSQEQLFDLAYGRKGSLWETLRSRARERPDFAAAHQALGELLRIADFTTPHQFLESVLAGPMKGRSKLYKRLGHSARDPIDELVSSALEFERSDTASLDRFLDWFSRGEVEVKREAGERISAVRVMTVHGAKGLEAPVVILADATLDPSRLGGVRQSIEFPLNGGKVPLVRPRQAERLPPFEGVMADDEALELEEHWRLLYVAMTRAMERLIVAGIDKGERKDNCWHLKVEAALEALGAQWEEAGEWPNRLVYRGPISPRALKSRPQRTALPTASLPDWVTSPAPPEARPPQPLAPSAIAVDDEMALPPTEAMRAAATRGTLIHQLLESLPTVSADRRADAARRWLERSAGLVDAALRDDITEQVCAIISHPEYAPLFGPGSLGEAPLAATLPDGRVIAGTVDRLLVERDRIAVIDFKTGRMPESSEKIPNAHRAQMKAYCEALRVIFPGRSVSAALLYTAGPVLHELHA
jgi:ATP-dependent helicase/nuclease subunit A